MLMEYNRRTKEKILEALAWSESRNRLDTQTPILPFHTRFLAIYCKDVGHALEFRNLFVEIARRFSYQNLCG